MCLNYLSGQNLWINPSYAKHDLILYSGAGASSRHFDKNYLSGKYDSYLKSPFMSVGFDYCFANRDVLWGVGLFFSSSVGRKDYNGSGSNVGKIWSSSLLAVKFTHHNKYFVRNKIDLCSGYIIGVRMKSYERVYSDGIQKNNNSERTYQLAIGISGTIKYYVTDRLAVYAEGALGYNVDVFQIGIARRIKNLKKN
jgi:hypothetical protein